MAGDRVDSRVAVTKGTGCRLHDDCLTCPLPECIYDRGGVNVISEERHIKIRQMCKVFTKNAVAECYGVSIRTVQRALKEKQDG